MNILVTGAMGFSGRHMVEHLKQNSEHTVIDIDLPQCDLCQPDQVTNVIRESHPHAVYHLAGSMTNDFPTDYAVNVTATYNLLQAVAELTPATRILLIGSAAEYGIVAPEENPIGEDHPLQPVSVYGMTKVFQTELMQYFRRRFELHIVMARSFNLYGRDMSPQLFVGKLYEQIAEYKKGTVSQIHMGALQHKRDFIPIDEAIKNYMLVMENGISGTIFNIGRGYSITCEEMMKTILDEEGLPVTAVTQSQNPDVTPYDVPDIYADITALRSCW